MAKAPGVTITYPNIQPFITVPERYGWRLKQIIEKEFPIIRHDGNGNNGDRHVDYFKSNPKVWTIAVTIKKEDEKKFYSLIAKFCQNANIDFEQPSEKPVK